MLKTIIAVQVPLEKLNEIREMCVGDVKKTESISIDTSKPVMIRKPDGLIKSVSWKSFDQYTQSIIWKNTDYKVLHINN